MKICSSGWKHINLLFCLLSLYSSAVNFGSFFQEVLVRFSGFGAEEDEWVNIRKHVRMRSLPCEASECVAVLPGDLILCFQVSQYTPCMLYCLFLKDKRIWLLINALETFD